MSLKKKYNHRAEHNKSSQALEKRGIAGFLITEKDGQTMVTLFGPKQRAMMSVQAALMHNEWINSMARFVIEGPTKVNVTKSPGGPSDELDPEADPDAATVSDYDTMMDTEPAGTILEQPHDDE